MLKKGAVTEARSIEGKTPLYEAAKRGQTAAVDLLVSNGADMTARSDHPGFTPLHVAAEYNHHETVTFLLTQGVDIEIKNDWQQTPLSQASWRFADRDLIALLIEHMSCHPGFHEFFTSVVPGEHSPRRFYERLGFEATGEEFDGETVMKFVR